MPYCQVCGKESPTDATFCSSCGSNLSITMQPKTETSPPTVTQITPIAFEQRLEMMVKRLERVSYITAIAASILLVSIIVLLVA